MHDLDKEVEDILQHYGIKGMKWRKRKVEDDDEEAQDDNAAGGGEDEESDLEEMFENLSDSAKDAVKSLKKSLSKMDGKIMKSGRSLFKSLKSGAFNTVGYVDHKRRNRQRQKEVARAMVAAMQGKKYKQKQIPLSKWEKKQVQKQVNAINKAYKNAEKKPKGKISNVKYGTNGFDTVARNAKRPKGKIRNVKYGD